MRRAMLEIVACNVRTEGTDNTPTEHTMSSSTFLRLGILSSSRVRSIHQGGLRGKATTYSEILAKEVLEYTGPLTYSAQHPRNRNPAG